MHQHKVLQRTAQLARLTLATRGVCSNSYDVIISGGGMVGTAAAASLGKSPLFRDKKILLLESAPPKPYVTPPTYSNRVSALSPASKRLLESTGAWKVIEESGRYQPVTAMYVWDACSDAKISFSPENQEEHLAYLVENNLTVHSLFKVVEECRDTVELAHGTSVDKYEFGATPSDLVNVHLSTGDTISTRLVIGADGFKSLARQSAGIDVLSWNYGQVGLVATLKLDTKDSGNNTAWQRFLPSGPIAVLPLTSDISSLVWSTSPKHAKSLLSLSPESFVDELNHALHNEGQKDGFVTSITEQFQQVVSSFSQGMGMAAPTTHTRLPPTVLDIDSESRASFPYGMMHSNKYIAPRLALVGDAGHRIHPLAGQGVNLGFGDVECLVRNLTEAVSTGADIGWTDHLAAYETERQRHVVSMTAGVEGLYRLYSTDWTALVLARSLGLMTVNALLPIKSFFMKHAQA